MVRQAQLKAEYADRYPSLDPGVWYTAAAAAASVKGTTIVRDGPEVSIGQRVLAASHFTFRGGMDHRGSWGGRHARRMDRHSPTDIERHRRPRLAV